MTQSEPLKDVSRVPRRDVHFAIENCDVTQWHGRGREVSHFFSAMSVLFPEGEKFFIEAVRHYQPRITDPALVADVKGFIGQEAMHGREHRVYNELLQKAGYDAAMLERVALNRLNLTRRILHPIQRLAITICLEHFTAIMAETLMADAELLEGSDPEMAAMWRWHAMEETEHKAVAFDVYQTVMARRPFRAWLLRCIVMLSVTVNFIYQSWRNYFHFLRRDGRLTDLRGWGRLFKVMVISPGPLRRIILPWLAWFRPGFHPWQQDNRHRLDQMRPEFEARLRISGA